MDENISYYPAFIDSDMKMKIAVTCGDLSVVKEMIDKNICLDVALENSIYCNEAEILKMTLEKGVNINTVGNSSKTPLFLSVSPLVDYKIFDILLHYNPDLNHKDKAGRNILHFIFDEDEFGDQGIDLKKIFRLLPLLSNEVSGSKNYRGQTILHFIDVIHEAQIKDIGKKGENKCKRCAEFVQELLQRNIPVNSIDMFGNSPIHHAAKCACEDSMKLLIQAGASVSLEGYPPLIHSLCESLEEESFASCLNILLENGCSINENSSDGKTPLHIATAAEVPNVEILRCLTAKGADIHSKDNQGNNCIHTCVLAVDLIDQNQAYEMETLARIEIAARQSIDFLCSKGIDLNEGNEYGFTALHYAMEMTKIDLVKCLLDLGGNINIKAYTGETPLHRAVKVMPSLKTVFEKFAPESPSVEITDKYGSSPLHWAFLNRCESIFQLRPDLMEHLSDGVDCKGRTPEDLLLTLHFEHFLTCIGISSVCKSESGFSSDHDYYPDLSGSQAEGRWSLSEETLTKQVGESVPVFDETDCASTDVFGCCELLSYITADSLPGTFEEEVHVVKWESHLVDHKESVRRYTNIVLESTDNGLYFDFVDNMQIEHSVDKFVRIAAERIAKMDPLLECKVELMGSRNEGTKIGYPDEFDYVFQLQAFENYFVPEESQHLNGYARLRIKESKTHTCFRPYLNENSYLDAKQIVCCFYKAFNKVLDDNNLLRTHNLYPFKFVDPHKFSIDDVQFRWTGASYKNIQISVDIVPCVRVGKWLPLCFESTRQLLKHFHINPEVCLVMKTQNSETIENWTTYFRISIATMEAAIMKAIPWEIRKGYILVKALKDSSYFPIVMFDNTRPGNYTYITTYMIKCTFLHALEERIQDEAGNSKEGSFKSAKRWANIITEKMLNSIENETMPGFFLKNNLLDKVQDGIEIIRDLHVFRAQLTCLQKLVECGTK